MFIRGLHSAFYTAMALAGVALVLSAIRGRGGLLPVRPGGPASTSGQADGVTRKTG